ncbi:TIGR04104 family putative zinc finger protein [Lysinibacillus sp. NPDC097287]|uniref:TIGR04104 family putative zinc finger protein n=1 Tax=Lysinibacillus sp. NPDC097287 TaxID=3364144 RepID=UPI0038035E22
MTRFKEDVLRELQDIKLTDQKKREMAQKARMQSKVRRSGQWQYRIVLATFTICAIGFSYLFSRDEENKTGGNQGATVQQETDTSSFFAFIDHDVMKGLLILSFFICATSIVKHKLKKRGYGLPKCIECGGEWSHKQARKFFWENRKIECSHCGKKQYRTKKSVQLGLLLNIPISMMAIMGNFFDNFLVGITFYLVSLFIYYHQLVPYLFDLQEKDPTNDPLW